MTEDIRTLSKWLNEESTAPIDRQALARVLAIAQQEPADEREERPNLPDGMQWFYCTTDVKEVNGHQVWRVAGVDLADAQARFVEGDGEIEEQEIEVTDTEEPTDWKGHP